MREILSSVNAHVSIKKQVKNLHNNNIVTEVASSVTKTRVVVVGMIHNESVYAARKALKTANIPDSYLEYVSYFSQWRRRLA